MSEIVFNDYINFSQKKYKNILEVYNKDIHPKLEKKFFKDKSLIEEEREKAKIMSNFLSSLKETLTTGENKGAVVFPKTLLNILGTRVFGLSDFQKHYSGISFEKDLVSIINAVWSVSRGHERSYGGAAKRIGGYTTTPDLFLDLSEELNSDLNEFIDKADTAIIDHKSVPGATHMLSKVTGKIDVTVNNFFTQEFSIEVPGLEQFLWAVSGANFSAKNYLLKTIVEKGVKIGSSKKIRQMGSALSFIFDNPNRKDTQRVLTLSMKSKSSKVQAHLKHLSAIYELAGAGQIYYAKGSKVGKNYGIANYLIINENSAFAPIKVFSTRALIQDYVMGNNNNYNSKLTGGNTVTLQTQL